MEILSIFENNKIWIEQKLNLSPTYFKDLAKDQAPHFLYIGCSDSRVTAEELMGLSPGEAFIHRNIANIAPVGDSNSEAVIHYAVSYLNVDHIIVCGHYGCGGIKAALDGGDFGPINNWLEHIKEVIKNNSKELDAILDYQKRYEKLVELNAIAQTARVREMKEVQEAMKNRNLRLHSWVFDMATGKLIDISR